MMHICCIMFETLTLEVDLEYNVQYFGEFPIFFFNSFLENVFIRFEIIENNSTSKSIKALVELVFVH